MVMTMPHRGGRRARPLPAAAAWAAGCGVALTLAASLVACGDDPAEPSADRSADDPGGLTRAEACALRLAVRSVAARTTPDGVVVTWQDDRARTRDVTYLVARQAPGEGVWQVVVDVDLAPRAARRAVDPAPVADAVYTVALDDGCVDDPADLCAPDRACPTATPVRDP